MSATTGAKGVAYSRTQIGWWLLAALGMTAIVTLGLLSGLSVGRARFPPASTRIIPATVLVVLVVTAALLSTLNVRIEGDTLTWRFGPGLVRFSLPLTEIASVAPGRSSLLAGIGIHWVGTGWVYNVSGRNAVEITKRDGRKIWLGTPEPIALAAAIERARAAISPPAANR